jgi:hypothetical protein
MYGMLQDDLHALSKLTVLEQLTLTGPAAPSSRVSAGLVAGIAPLTQLQTLTLKLRACPFTMLRPDLPPILLGSLVQPCQCLWYNVVNVSGFTESMLLKSNLSGSASDCVRVNKRSRSKRNFCLSRSVFYSRLYSCYAYFGL